MADANLLNGLSAVKAMLGKTRFAVLDERDAAQIARWFGADGDRLAQALGRTGTGEEPEAYELGGITFTRSYFLNRGQPRVCLHCLADSGICMLAWEISSNCACSLHGELLTATCPNCLGALRWDRPHTSQCRCGWLLRAAVSEEPTAEEIDIAVWIEQAFGAHARPKPSTQLGRLLDPLGLDAGLHILSALSSMKHGRPDAPVSICTQLRKRNSIASARNTIANAAVTLEELGKGLQGRWEVPTSAIELLAEACASSYASPERQLAISILSSLRCKPGTGNWRSKFPQHSQLTLF